MNRPGFIFCICPDSALIKQYMDSIVKKFPPANNPESNILGGEFSSKWTKKVFWGDDGLDDSFWDALGVQDIFGGGRLIIIRNSQQLLADSWKKLNKALARANPSIWVFVCLEVEFERAQPKIPAHVKRLKAFEFAEKQGWVWSNSGLSGKGMQDYLQTKAKNLGITIPAPLLPELAQKLPNDATAISLELEKLALLLGPNQKELLPEHLEQIGSQIEINVFAVLRDLQARARPDKIWATVLASESAPAKDKMLFSFLGALTREARTLWQLLFGEKVFVPGNLAHDKLALARQLGVRKLAEFWELALDAEQGVKSGEFSEDQALERLMANLSRLFAR